VNFKGSEEDVTWRKLRPSWRRFSRKSRCENVLQLSLMQCI